MPEGLEIEAVTAWLLAEVDGLAGPLTFERLAGGNSNLTFRVRDAVGRDVVLRRPPLGGTLQSAHDMAREYRIITALAGTAVPVPRPLGLCEDPAVTGATFYVMEHVDGVVAETVQATAPLTEEQRAAAADSLVDVLADLHAVDPGAVGLGTLGRTEDYLGRQLRRWQRQWEASRTRGVPEVDEVHALLEAGMPAQARSGIVHGDFRLGNLVLGPGGHVRAILDWELCTLGDPLADLGWTLVYWMHPGEPGRHLRYTAPSALPGFPTRDGLVARYRDRTGADMSAIDFYTAFACWRLACIMEGVHRRHVTGAMGRVDPDRLQALADQVGLLATHALELLERYRAAG